MTTNNWDLYTPHLNPYDGFLIFDVYVNVYHLHDIYYDGICPCCNKKARVNFFISIQIIKSAFTSRNLTSTDFKASIRNFN